MQRWIKASDWTMPSSTCPATFSFALVIRALLEELVLRRCLLHTLTHTTRVEYCCIYITIHEYGVYLQIHSSVRDKAAAKQGQFAVCNDSHSRSTNMHAHAPTLPTDGHGWLRIEANKRKHYNNGLPSWELTATQMQTQPQPCSLRWLWIQTR